MVRDCPNFDCPMDATGHCFRCDVSGVNSGQEITDAMIAAGLDQHRVDSGLSLNDKQRMGRVLRAALTGQVDRTLFHESIRGL